MSSCPLRETTPYSKFAPKPSENTSVYSTEEHELLVYKDEQNVDIIWKVAGFTKRKFSFVAEEDPISSPVLFSDGSRDLVAIVGANRLVLFDETGTDLFWQLEYVFSSSFSSNLLELSWAIILPLTSNNKSILYLLFQKKERKLYFLRGIHQGERVVYCCADLPLLVTYDEVLETLSLVLCNEEKTPCDGDVCFGKQDLDSLFIERIDEMFQVTPKELCFFHDEMGQLYLAIVDHEAYLYFLRVQGAIWSPKKQSNMHVEKLQLEKKLKAFVSIQAVLLTREEFHDLLCLDNMGILHVYVGCLWIFRFQLFWVSEVSISFTVIRDNEELLKREGRLSFRIKSLKDSIASNITLEMEDGRLFRTSLDCFRPHTQPTKDMLTCSFAALTPELGCLLRSLWIFYMFQDWNDPLSTLSHCIEWKSLEQSLEILRRYFVYAHEHSLEWNDVVDLILSKLSNGEVGARNESVQSLSDYSFMSYLTRKYSIFYKTWNIPHPLEENSLQVPMDNRPLIPFHDSIGQILYSLTSVFHLLYESYKTCITNENHLEAVARELKEWASLLGLTEWMEHYDRDLLHPTYYNYQYVVQVPSPCCIFDALSGAIIGSFRDWNCLKKAIQSFSFRGLYHPLQRLDKICTAIEIIFQKDTQTTIAIPSWLQDILPTLPLSLSTLLYDALHMLKLHSNEDNNNWMESHLDCLYYDNFSRWLGMEMETRGWNTSHNVVEIESMYQEDLITDFDASHYTSGMEMNDPCVDMRFAADRRTLEVQHALDSASPLSLDSVDWKDLYENDSPVVSSNKLLGKLQKNLGVCIGRGAFTLSTFISFDPTEPIRIPQIW